MSSCKRWVGTVQRGWTMRRRHTKVMNPASRLWRGSRTGSGRWMCRTATDRSEPECHRLLLRRFARQPELARVVIDKTSLIVAELDLGGRLICANRAFSSLLERCQWKPGSSLRRHLSTADFRRLKSACSGGRSDTFRITFIATTGERSYECHAMRTALGAVIVGDIEESDHLLVSEFSRINSDLADAGRSLVKANAELERANEEIRALSRTDPLTQLANRHWLSEVMPREIARSLRSERPLSLMLTDIDHFKRVNDEFGHPAGDATLRAVAAVLKSKARSTDLVVRYGGEEMLILLPDTDLTGGCRLSERIRQALERKPVAEIGRPITMSFGVSQLRNGDELESLVERADKALYRAKQSGRNRVVAEQGDQPKLANASA